MHSMRAQLSLYFTDEELYNNLVQPERLNKTLQDLVKRLLASYYYNSKVRELVDSGEADSSDNSSTSQAQQLLNDIRSNLAMFQFQTDSLQDLVSDGVEYFQNKGSEDTEFGATVPRYNTDMLQQKLLEVKGISQNPQTEDNFPKVGEVEKPTEPSSSEARLESLERNMKLILRRLGIEEDEGINKGTAQVDNAPEPVVETKTSTQFSEPVVESKEPVAPIIIEEPEVRVKPVAPVSTPEPSPVPNPVPNPVPEETVQEVDDMEEVDSSQDFLNELLNSCG